MTPLELTRQETRVLQSIDAEPRPAGDISPEVLRTLLSRGLLRLRLGHCTITPLGQLELHRQRFRKHISRAVERAAPSRPPFLREFLFSENAPARAILRDIVVRHRPPPDLTIFEALWGSRRASVEDRTDQPRQGDAVAAGSSQPEAPYVASGGFAQKRESNEKTTPGFKPPATQGSTAEGNDTPVGSDGKNDETVVRWPRLVKSSTGQTPDATPIPRVSRRTGAISEN